MYLQVLSWAGESSRKALEELADLAIIVDDWTIHRAKALAAALCERLRSYTVEGYEVSHTPGQADRVVKVIEMFRRGPPSSLVLAWHKRWGQILLDIKLS
jgi:hypothetical protein